MKRYFMVAVVILLMLLTACSGGETQIQETESPTFAPTEPPMVDIGGTVLDREVTELCLADTLFELDMLCAAASELKNVQNIELGLTDLNAQELEVLRSAYPDATLNYQMEFLGQILSADTEYLDMSGMSAEQAEELAAILPAFSQIQEINFVAEDGSCVFCVDSLGELDKIRLALPEAYLRVSFELFGQTVTSETERVEFYRVAIGNEGVETIRAALPYLVSCTYALFDGCGIDDEIMAQMRDDFPETEIVWRIWLVKENYRSAKMLRCGSYLTDTHRIRTTYVRNENAHLLNYCTKTIYMDIGHIPCLEVCDFLNYMPDLEVCILAITGITDITPLANHEKLEYLELFSTDIADLSPLASCTNLEHLNISNMPNLVELSPLSALQNLKRIRIVRNANLEQSEITELQEQLTECEFLIGGEWPTSGGWRYVYTPNKTKVERYALLCEQMEYTIDARVYGID